MKNTTILIFISFICLNLNAQLRLFSNSQNTMVGNIAQVNASDNLIMDLEVVPGSSPEHAAWTTKQSFTISFYLVNQQNPTLKYPLNTYLDELWGESSDAFGYFYYFPELFTNSLRQIPLEIPCNVPAGDYYLRANLDQYEFITGQGTLNYFSVSSTNPLNGQSSSLSNDPSQQTYMEGFLNVHVNNTITNPGLLTLTATDQICTDYAIITPNLIGGVAPITYFISGFLGPQSSPINTYNSGKNIVYAFGQDGCMYSAEIIVPHSEYTINSTLTVNEQPGQCAYNSGSITVNPINGVAPFYYNWGSNTTAVQTFNYLTAGNNTVTITDAHGCTGSNSTSLALNTNGIDYPNGYSLTSAGFQDFNGDNIIRIMGIVNVPLGVSCTISGKTIEFMNAAPNSDGIKSGLIVQQGATFTASNCTFRGASCARMWDGFQVLGNGVTNGKLNLTNCQILDAVIGVATYKVTSTTLSTETGCGIAKIKKCTFTNNRESLCFKGFTASTNNSSYIAESNFKCTALLKDQFLYPNESIVNFAKLTSINGPYFAGNIFSGNLNLSVIDRGIGIIANESSFTVRSGDITESLGSATNYIPNTFKNLYKGIVVSQVQTSSKNCLIKDNRFQNTLQSIVGTGGNFTEISYNVFTVPSGVSSANQAFGIFTKSPNSFTITANTFATVTPNIYSFGSICQDANLNNCKIYKNNFSGSFNTASLFKSNNSKLQATCNSYTGTNTFDWDNQGGLSIQGTPQLAAANVFGSCSVSDASQISNGTQNLIYYHPTNISAITCKSSTVTIMTAPQNGCPAIVSSPNPFAVSQIMISQTDKEIVEKVMMDVYPNPSNNSFNVKISEGNIDEITVFNMLGEKIVQSKLIDNRTEIDLSNYPQGIYLVKAFDGGEVLLKKIVKQ